MTDCNETGELVLLSIDAKVATVTLNRPERHNSLVPEMLSRLHRVLCEIDGHRDVGVVVITANGPSFSTGGDLGAFRRARNELTEYADRLVGLLNDVIAIITELDVPTLAVVDGQVTGGSVGIVLACDLVVVSERASFSPWYVDVGFSPDGGWTAMLPAVVGAKRAASIQLLNETISADQALEWGLACLKADSARLDRGVAAICERLLSKKSGSLSCTKQLLRQSGLREALEKERLMFLERISVPETVAGVDEFLQKWN